MSVDMLRDVTSFKSHKGKSVMMASRSIIHLYRDINPDMLHRKDRVRQDVVVCLGSSLFELLVWPHEVDSWYRGRVGTLDTKY